ncbi:subtilisin family serine protease [Pseudosporangium ferrugineum]|uniref:Subtilisin family serine protease n=1 Tax=Pseudosporangium ferrugineum TaxID=439699 RepID=A0A2T0RLB3_9ACTN|nr:subtilisin family serine protease [Pseudosporangium ferrugineum]
MAAVAALAVGGAVLGQVYLAGPEADAAQEPDRSADAGTAVVPVAGTRPGPRTVTLVTGDRVTVAGPDATRPSIEPGPGRAKVSFATSVVGGHLRVVPSDAARLIQSGRVDERLFDVTELIRAGYTDAERRTVPLIVRYKDEDDAREAIDRGGAKITRRLPVVRGAAVSAPKPRTQKTWSELTAEPGVQKIWLDGVRRRTLDASVPQIGAPAAWAAGLTGKGMTVAVIDGAADTTHPDLAGRVTLRNFVEGTDAPVGGDVHGTHVASTIAGSGAASGGKFKGVAPEATVLSAMACGEVNCPESALLAAMQWAAVEQKARVINMSVGGLDRPGLDPVEESVNRLTAETGALFVVAAGNNGPVAGEIDSPGSADAALTVGAVDKEDAIADFSSRGPRNGDRAIKPDITAPGVDIVAAKAAGSDREVPPGTPDGYIPLRGTSMATPHVSGAALLLAQAHPGWRADRLKRTLMATARPNDDLGPFEQGAGRVDVAAALSGTLTAEPPSVSYGQLRWPHDEDASIAKKVTYHNDGPQAVELTLALAGSDVFTLGAGRLDVPAGGTAEVTVTAKLPRTAENTTYTGRLTATAGDRTVVTPLAVDKEPERYTVTVRHIDAAGKAAKKYRFRVFDPKGEVTDLPSTLYDPSGTLTMRLPKGRFTMASYVDSSGGDGGGDPDPSGRGADQAVIFHPLVDVDRDVDLTFDARRAKPVAQRVPGESAVARGVNLSLEMKVDGAPVELGVVQETFEGLAVDMLGSGAGVTDLTGVVTSGWTRSGDAESSPYAYFVADRVPAEKLLAGYDRKYAESEFATETQEIHGPAGTAARQWLFPTGPAGESFGASRSNLRSGRVNHYSVAGGFRWSSQLGLDTDGTGTFGGLSFFQGPRAYPAGKRTRQVWGQAPYGQVFNPASQWVTRASDTLSLTMSPFGDAAGHAGIYEKTTARTKLFRDDTLLDDAEGLTTGADGLPDAAATYRVEQTTEGGIDGLSTRTATKLTFRSSRPSGADQAVPPVIAVHFGVPKAGKLPVDVRDATGEPVRTRRLAVEYSADDGKTWKTAPVTGGSATVKLPAGTAFVSLRAHATSAAGSTAEQTVIRAYRPA